MMNNETNPILAHPSLANAVSRREFLQLAATSGTVLLGTEALIPAVSEAKTRTVGAPQNLRIDRILIQVGKGSRLTPVAPNAYAAYRGYYNEDVILRVRAGEFEGIGHGNSNAQALGELIGVNPFDLFLWGEGDTILGPAEKYVEFFEKNRWCDVAIMDLLGKVLQKPISALLGKRLRKEVLVYDSSLYMEDLLTPEQQKDLIYIKGAMPANPVDMVARKAEWLINRPEGFTAVKLKTGRSKWMPTFEEALQRDIDVTHAVRQVIGPKMTLLVDTNKAYAERPWAAYEYLAAAGEMFFLEEPFPETDSENLKAIKRMVRTTGNPVLFAAGESFFGGVPEKLRQQRVVIDNHSEPLINVEQADMNQNGILGMTAIAKDRAALGMSVAPHNFGSKMGFYSQIHLGLVTPNWLFSEVDDSQVPALDAIGISVKNGKARLMGEPGLGVRLDESKLEAPRLKFEL